MSNVAKVRTLCEDIIRYVDPMKEGDDLDVREKSEIRYALIKAKKDLTAELNTTIIGLNVR